jgi:probable rRNA maturation factor
MSVLVLRNRHPSLAANLPLLRQITRSLLTGSLAITDFALGVFLVNTAEMTRLNGAYLGHAGSTDVIAFDHSETGQPPTLFGEIYISLDEARLQARRYRATWQAELVRYLVHGVLHLRGYDDRARRSRRRMKREEDRVFRGLARRFRLSQLARRPRVGP